MSQLAPNESFWLAEIGTHDLQPPLDGGLDVDVAFVGGGYTSLVAACLLKEARPDYRVAVLETEFVGFGASGRNAGMLLAYLHPDRAKVIGKDALKQTYQDTLDTVDLIESFGFDCDLERCGFLHVGLYPAHQRKLAKMQKTYASYGYELPLWDTAQTREALNSQRFTSSLFNPYSAMLHPGKYISGLKRLALQRGVAIYEKTPVLKIRQGRQVELETPGGRVHAGQAVLGLNAYLEASRLAPIRNPSVSLKSFIMLTDELEDRHWDAIRWRGRQGYTDLRRIHNYVRLTGRRIVFGGRVTYSFGVGSKASEDQIYANLRKELLATFPELHDVGTAMRWSGPVSITYHRTPVLVRKGNIWTSVGYSGLGVSLGTLCGRVLADLLQGMPEKWEHLLFLRDRPFPLPGEPFRWVGFKASYYGMKFADWWDSVRP